MNINCNIGALRLKTPVILASGTFGYGVEANAVAPWRYVGALITKTITEKPKEGNRPPRIYEARGGILNSIGLQNPGIDMFIKEKVPRIAKLSVPCIVSISADSARQFKYLARRLKACRQVQGLEMNLSCPNIQKKKLIAQDARLVFDAVCAVKAIYKKPVIAKLSPEVTDIALIARSAERAGADALSLVNTFYGLAIDIETGSPCLGAGFGGFSGSAIKPLSLYRVWKVCQAVHIPVIGGGGICSAADAIEFLLAGACAVSIGTVNFTYPDAAKKICKGIMQYMKDRNINSLQKISQYCKLCEE